MKENGYVATLPLAAHSCLWQRTRDKNLYNRSRKKGALTLFNNKDECQLFSSLSYFTLPSATPGS
jgi:hypothetical protein